tara:strand:- start:1851 stop:2267 length:417 start_codon:yes stop_codon:yes gene_type:complete
MKEIIGDDYPTYEDSVKMTLAEREKDSAYTYMTEVEHEINKQNIERLIKENLELRHRLSCIETDIKIIARHIENTCPDQFEKPSLNEDGRVYSDCAWHNISNIEIACDLSDESVKEWGSQVKSELTQDQIMEMEQQIR